MEKDQNKGTNKKETICRKALPQKPTNVVIPQKKESSSPKK